MQGLLVSCFSSIYDINPYLQLRTNTEHLEKVQERIRNDWNYDPPSDWGPTRLPMGTAAWDQSWLADRADDFIAFWLDNTAAKDAARCGEKPGTMDSFIDRCNKKYQDWLDIWYSGEAQVVDQLKEDEDEDEEDEGGEKDGWNAVPGLWYDDNSFFPREDGFNTVHRRYAPRGGDN